jgi:hypothetical protein
MTKPAKTHHDTLNLKLLLSGAIYGGERCSIIKNFSNYRLLLTT